VIAAVMADIWGSVVVVVGGTTMHDAAEREMSAH
jgi:hypothetical protein